MPGMNKQNWTAFDPVGFDNAVKSIIRFAKKIYRKFPFLFILSTN